MNKGGKIILVETDPDKTEQICHELTTVGHKNEMHCFTSSDEAGEFIRENLNDIFILLQSTNAPAIQMPDTRNMVYMHEKFKTDLLPYMFLVLTKNKTPLNVLHTFVHCYFKSEDGVPQVLGGVVSFWKEHIFPPRVSRL